MCTKIQFRNRISISVPVLSLKNRRDRKRGSFECEKDPLDPDPRFPWLGPEPAAAVGTVCFTGLARAQPHNPDKPQGPPAVAIQRHPPPCPAALYPATPSQPSPGADQLTLPHRHASPTEVAFFSNKAPPQPCVLTTKPAHMRHFSIMQLDGHNIGNGKSHHGSTVISPVIPRVLLPWYCYGPAILPKAPRHMPIPPSIRRCPPPGADTDMAAGYGVATDVTIDGPDVTIGGGASRMPDASSSPTKRRKKHNRATQDSRKHHQRVAVFADGMLATPPSPDVNTGDTDGATAHADSAEYSVVPPPRARCRCGGRLRCGY